MNQREADYYLVTAKDGSLRKVTRKGYFRAMGFPTLDNRTGVEKFLAANAVQIEFAEAA